MLVQRAAGKPRGAALARLRRTPIPFLLIAVYLIAGFTWAMTNAPFSAPDESQHYLRAIGISDGRLVGAKTNYDGRVLSRKETAWRHLLTRAVLVPPGLSPVGFECELFHPDVTAACADHVAANRRPITEQTDVGIYQPEPYLLPSVAVRLAHTPAAADRDGRLATTLLWIALLSVAIWALWDVGVGALSLLGVTVAVTPMVIFMGSSLSDSSLEIAASLAFFALLLRMTRAGAENSKLGWVLAGVVGAVLALSRSLGPLWVVCDVLIALALGRSLPARIRRVHVLPLAAAALVLVGVALNLLWVHLHGPHVSPTVIPSISALHNGVSQLRAAWNGVIGVFGYEDVPLGRFGVFLWTLMAAAIVLLAVSYSTWRERVAVAVSAVLAVAVPTYIYAAVTSAEGIQTQGRHILPLLVTLPLLAGELLRRHATTLPAVLRRVLFPSVCVVAGFVQLLAWWENSRRYAVGLHGSWWFLAGARWSPPAGWAPWAALVLAVAAAVIAYGLSSLVAALRDALPRRSQLAEQP